MIRSYKIASKIWQIEFDESDASKVLHEQLNLYEKVNNNEVSSDVYVRINTNKKYDFIANNPKIHFETENGFMCVFKRLKVLWEKIQHKIYIDIIFDNRRNIITKWNNLQFHYPYQRFGQIFHELVISPTLLMFIDDVILIHGSSVSNDMGGIIFSGSGGSGKTSISSTLLFDKNYKFIADDITYLNINGKLYGNFEFPKIYSYNVKQNPSLKDKVINNRGFWDKVQWVIKQKIPPFRVRRSINPVILYDNKIGKSVELKYIYNLFRCNCKEVGVEKISKEILGKMNYEIIKTEYHTIYRHIQFHKYNRLAKGLPTLVSEDEILKKYNKIQNRVLEKVDVFLLKIPIDRQISNYNELETILL